MIICTSPQHSHILGPRLSHQRNMYGTFPGMVRLSPLHCKKRLPIFPRPGWMSPNKLSLAGKSLVSDIMAGDGKIANHLLQCIFYSYFKKIGGQCHSFWVFVSYIGTQYGG
jgi:hypothetical protein